MMRLPRGVSDLGEIDIKSKTKVCKVCGNRKPLDEFYTGKVYKDGHQPDCKECRKASVIQWQKDNPERHRKKCREWVRKHYLDGDTEWIAQKNIDLQQWRNDNPDKRQAQTKRCYHNNKQAMYQRKQEWYKKHPEVKLAESRLRRARKANVDRPLTKEQWNDVLTAYGYKCVYCGSNKCITQDHVVPLSRGGTHSVDNVVPACHRCNSGKKDKPAPMFQRVLVL
jgi:hypothetical protein